MKDAVNSFYLRGIVCGEVRKKFDNFFGEKDLFIVLCLLVQEKDIYIFYIRETEFLILKEKNKTQTFRQKKVCVTGHISSAKTKDKKTIETYLIANQINIITAP